ncbi:HicA-like toxin [Mycobacterium phage Phayeta]|nr:HicA-like toxin [Mycobacterium phage Phayeta]
MARKHRGISKETQDLIRLAEQAGATVEKSKNGHFKVYVEGRMVSVIAGTASDWRSIKNTLAALRRAGLDI